MNSLIEHNLQKPLNKELPPLFLKLIERKFFKKKKFNKITPKFIHFYIDY